MKNFTLKTTSLLIITLLSSQAYAKSPWAEETSTNETSVDELQTQQSVEPESSQIAPPTPGAVEPESIADTPVEPLNEAQAVQTTATETQRNHQSNHQGSHQGDVLTTPNGTVSVHIIDFPRRGMTSDKVQNELGRPSEIIPAVGEPPISRWVYDDRTVYFEYSSVIHVVAK